MPERMPVVFVSHGAPDALIRAPATIACWGAIGRRLPRPAAILAVSAHWQTRNPMLSLSGAPETLHDFSGFSPALYRLRYPAPGAPALAERAAALLAGAGLTVELHPARGLDHGAWIPLSALFPQADVPVTQLSLVRNAGPAAHLALGRALESLCRDGVLVFASGAITHNFAWLDRQAPANAPPLPQAQAFADWVGERLAARDVAGLLDYRSAPLGAEAHPGEEHFLPLFVALGAAGECVPQRYQPGFTHAGLAMDAYVWQAGSAVAG